MNKRRTIKTIVTDIEGDINALKELVGIAKSTSTVTITSTVPAKAVRRRMNSKFMGGKIITGEKLEIVRAAVSHLHEAKGIPWCARKSGLNPLTFRRILDKVHDGVKEAAADAILKLHADVFGDRLSIDSEEQDAQT